ncbi:MAG: TonB-dependent receptor plug domain-containing protein [Taibaiella sp.]|nr:TonB-dependent receptor plug domain-containing protein [Taibaiella sp.]
MRLLITAILVLQIFTGTYAQGLKGKLFGLEGDTKEILPGGILRWIGTETVATANENGVFELPLAGISDLRIIASFSGFVTDTIATDDKTYLSIVLHPAAKSLSAVTITDKSAAYISKLNVTKTEVINQNELTKAACCDLAGCFGTQASVQPQTTNVVTNAQELRILGLSGVYNQVLFDGLPMIQGLSYTYGISTYPGTVVENIYVSKGTTSVLQGYESISGQINLDSRQPDRADRLLLNAYINRFGENHINANVTTAAGKKKKWHTLLALHMVQPARKVDGNGDGFLDLPLLTRYMAYSKWKYGNDRKKGFSTQIALRVVQENRTGGQNAYNATEDEGSNSVYGQAVDYVQTEAYAKSAYRFSADHALAFTASGFYHRQHSWFGTTHYQATQKNGYLNMQHEWQWKEKHLLKYGISYRYQDLTENIRFADTVLQRTYAGTYLTQLRVPGMFAENTFHWREDKVVLIAGARIDHHQKWGWRFTPRSMVKYAINDNHTFRASAGSGWRQVNLFSEQINLLASSRDIVFGEVLKPEAAFNWGLSHTYRFEIGSTTTILSGDFYSTHFTNQFFPDYDTDPTKAFIRNFEGASRSNGLQLEASFIFFKRLEFRTAYNYLDVYRVENGSKTYLPFNARNRTMGALSYRTRNSRWQGDINAHWFDAMRLPNTINNPAEYRRPSYSTPYTTVNVQATLRWKTLDIYAGCENLAGYRQPNPIIAADNPFSKYFDLSSVWGPVRGREFYIGARYTIKKTGDGIK